MLVSIPSFSLRRALIDTLVLGAIFIRSFLSPHFEQAFAITLVVNRQAGPVAPFRYKFKSFLNHTCHKVPTIGL